ncbi:Aste57867_24968 [Aphanomyces stellatus]|uniref:Aste57867_24968 protein n=1 Tax=Aphanomyces stellatus TaxID=120398 RepID=A0A485LSL3_9STRA|nr:hypothetical protein As57867_024890 [Aphanomyces stellatus]VFU01599.1 Aste57867_24968 [Aphanomyces stellatus]
MDIVTTLRNIEKTGNPEQLKQILPPGVAAPVDVAALLTTTGLGWDTLPTTAQVALMWSFGYVRYGSNNEYARVYLVANGTMESIQIPLASVASSDYKYCGANVEVTKSAKTTFNGVRCAINISATSSDIAPSTSGVYYGYAPGFFPLPPSVVLLKNNPSVVSLPYSIHILPSADTCSSGAYLANTIPCTELLPSTTSYALPTPPASLLAWLADLQKDPPRNNNSTGGNAVGSPKDESHATGMIVGLAVGAVVLVALAALLVWRRRRRHPKHEDPNTNVYLWSTNGMSVNDMELSNERLCDTSPILKAFQVDPAISFKRLDYASLLIEAPVAKASTNIYDVWFGHLDNAPVAIKQLAAAHRQKKHLVQFASALRTIVGLDHPNITVVIGLGWDLLENMCVVTEFMAHGTLRETLEAHALADPSKDAWDWRKTKLNMALDIAKALVYLHTLEVPLAHGALRSSNVLVDDTMTKLSAFAVGHGPPTTSGLSTRWEWIAPEVLSGQPTTTASDVFSFGVVLTELDTLAYPYVDTDSQRTTVVLSGRSSSTTLDCNGLARTNVEQKMQRVVHDGLRPCLSRAAPPALRELVELCLDADPAKRPTAMMLIYQLRSKVKVYEL